jgi:hypothetical protein
MSINRRPEITNELIDVVRQFIADNPGIGRTRLSILLSELWDWRDSTGRTKDMSCRDMLRALDKAGKITLPAMKCTPRRPGDSKGVEHLIHDETPINCRLKELQPLRVEVVASKADWQQFKSFVDQYHYLKFDRCISESMAYQIYSSDGKPLASLLFGSPAWSCRERDIFIGWGKDERKHNLNMVANNSRYVIYPFVNVPHLASHILSLISKRIAADWDSKYGHQVCLLETFVESPTRFRGTCYKAANWLKAGKTTGRGRNGGHKHAIVPEKDIYLYPLAKNWRSILNEQ